MCVCVPLWSPLELGNDGPSWWLRASHRSTNFTINKSAFPIPTWPHQTPIYFNHLAADIIAQYGVAVTAKKSSPIKNVYMALKK
jgi:hypothetical protein